MNRYLVSNRVPKIILPVLIAAWVLFAVSCGELGQSKPDTFYSETEPPGKQVFRWSNGKMPKSFDPAMASAPPETDIVRAVYEGLTDTDPKSLAAVPAVAKTWTSSDKTKIWTFVLRNDVYWSNGEQVTAHDFERSWKRLSKMGSKAPHHALLHNFRGIHPKQTEKEAASKKLSKEQVQPSKPPAKSPEPAKSPTPKTPEPVEANVPFAVEVLDKFRLRVTLERSDEDFPKLVAHPMFRPIYGDGDHFETDPVSANIVTNGAFRITSVGADGITLDREERYFDRAKIRLERVLFVPAADPDSALAAYKAGEVDAVTNTAFEPLALKILTPYVDFRRTTHSALNFYEFNQKQAPYNDRRVREALAIAIDRQSLADGEMEGSTQPAFDFLPFDVGREKKISSDAGRAKELLEKAGFPDAEGFPKIRLLINRNNVQEKIAKSVARMWKEALKVETEIIVKDSADVELIVQSGEFDMVRRGVVLPTADEAANMLAIFSPDKGVTPLPSPTPAGSPGMANSNTSAPGNTNSAVNSKLGNLLSDEELIIDTGEREETIITEAEAIASIPAIPLYFPTTYSLVKPYVIGFELNTLDAPSLKNVYIDNAWQPKKKPGQS